jgi:hypothetical protein
LSQFPHDEFAKDLLDSLLQPYGHTEPAKVVSSEAREIDLYFTPKPTYAPSPDLGLLGKLAQTPASFEPYRNPATLAQVKSCMAKLWDVQSILGEIDSPPHLWILTPTFSVDKLRKLGAQANLELSPSGIYDLAPAFDTSIVVIHQLPDTPETLWLRIMGRNNVQLQAAQEIAALPPDSRYQSKALKLLSNLRVQLDIKKRKTVQERNLIMTLSPIFVAQLEQAEQQGIQLGIQLGMALGTLSTRFGEISPDLFDRLRTLDAAKISSLRKDLVTFRSLDDLEAWLAQ